MPLDLPGYLLIGVAAIAAGAINAAAGGGTLITFPAMLAAGMTPLAANITSALGLLTGSLGGALSFRRELANQRRRFLTNAPWAAGGAVLGAIALLVTPGEAFTAIVPWLVFAAAALFAVQPWIARWLGRADQHDTASTGGWPMHLAFVAIGAYGAYFGAGIGVMMLAALGLIIHDSIQRHSAMKNIMALVINGTGALILVFSPLVHWGVVLIMLIGALVGGFAGGWLARRVPGWLLRTVVVTIAVSVGVSMLLA